MASIGNSKALMGCIFLQYCGYALFYLMDEIMGLAPSHYNKTMQDHNQPKEGDKVDAQEEQPEVPGARKQAGKQKPDQLDTSGAQKKGKNARLQQEGGEEMVQYEGGVGRRRGQQQQQQQEEYDEEDEEGADEYDAEDPQEVANQMQQRRQMQEQMAQNKKLAMQTQMASQGKSEAAQKLAGMIGDKVRGDVEDKKEAILKKLENKLGKNTNFKQQSDQDLVDYQKWENARIKSISNQIVEYFPQTMIFHTIIVSMCAIRSPTDFATACTIFAMIMRIVIVFGYYCNKKIVFIGAGAIEVFINFLLLFIAMSYSQHA